MKRSMIESSQSLIQPPVKKSHFANNDQLLVTISNFPLELLTHPSAFQEIDSNQVQSSSEKPSNSKIDYNQPIIIINDNDEDSDSTDQFLLNKSIKSSHSNVIEEMEIIFIDDEKGPKKIIDNIQDCDTITLTYNKDDGNNAANNNNLHNESCPILDITPFTFPSIDATNNAAENAVESINNNNNNNGIKIVEQIIIEPSQERALLDAETQSTYIQSLSLLNYQSKKIPELNDDIDQVQEKLRLERKIWIQNVDTWNKMPDIEKCSKDFITKFGVNIWQDPVESVLDINYENDSQNNIYFSKEFEDEMVKKFTSKENDRNCEIIDNAFSKVMESIVNNVNKETHQNELLNDLRADLLISEDKLQNTLENSCIISGTEKEISTPLTNSAELKKDAAEKNNSPSFTDDEAIESILMGMNKIWFKH